MVVVAVDVDVDVAYGCGFEPKNANSAYNWFREY